MTISILSAWVFTIDFEGNMLKFTLSLLLSLFSLSLHANAIIDLNEGLTLAQIENGGQLNTLAVVEDEGRAIKGINLSEVTDVAGDIVSTYQRLGYEKIADIVLANRASLTNRYPYSQLLSPAGTGRHHIALGLNYPEHADEVEADRRPFLFLKTTRATREQSITTGDTILLDYEIEVCARPLQDIDADDRPASLVFGFFICGDFTDRAALMRGIDLDNMQSGRGFSVAKSREGFFPTGPYLVIPKDREAFLTTTSFSLYRGNALKQASSTANMIWSLDTIVDEIFTAQRSKRPTHSSKSKQWLNDDKITTDMVVLTGTPDGVIMRPPSFGFKFASGIGYLFKGGIFDMSLRDYVVRSYIKDLFSQGIFLQGGERVVAAGDFMGRIDMQVVVE
ncbi:fumarylacetoacetate hydrolase family protein [Exilibacterium tricleocarpae]|nr:fumarylacetoacetate hydrolase family protein [Exilibacterium tricleocarpae]